MTAERTFDWRPRFSPLSLRYKISDNFSLTKTPRNRNWRKPCVLDQGREGACTGFGASHVLCATPKARQDVSNEFAQHIYYEARRRDQWPGENYEGSSVLGAMEASKSFGYISAYYWATTLDEIIHGVSLFGPMEIGVPWYSNMMETTADGYLDVSGTELGGHAVCLGGVSVRDSVFRLDNSWGTDWGVNGSAKLRFADMDRLLHQMGEAALPKKIKFKATT